MFTRSAIVASERKIARNRRLGRRLLVVASVLGVGVVALMTIRERLLSNVFGSPFAERGLRVENVPAITFGFGELINEWDAPEPWRSRSIMGPVNVRVEESEELGLEVLRIKSNQSHYIIWDQTRTYDPAEYPVLAWSWSAVELPTGGSVLTHDESYFSRSNKNDKGLQVLVGFEGGKALMYAWDSTAPVDTEVMENSPVAKIATRIVDSGPPTPGEWRQHQFNIRDDYIRRFGEEPGLVLGVAIQANSNHTGSSSDGLVSPIEARRHVQ